MLEALTRHESQATIKAWGREVAPGGPERMPGFALGLLEEAFRLALAAGASAEEAFGRCFAVANRPEYAGVAYQAQRPDAREVAPRAGAAQVALILLCDRGRVDRRAAVDGAMDLNRSRVQAGESS